MKHKLFWLAALVTAVMLGSTWLVTANADDTYNFYFQKAPGPTTVNQGSAPAKTSDVVVPPATAASSAASAPAIADVSPSRRTFFLTAGYGVAAPFSVASRREMISGQKDQYLSGAFALKAEADLSENFSLTADVYKLKNEVNTGSAFFYDTTDPMYSSPAGSKDNVSTSAKSVFDFAAGMAWSPVRLHATTFSFLAGAQSVPSLHYAEISRHGTTVLAGVEDGVKHEILPYAGARLRLLADNVWGIEASYRVLPSKGLSTFQAGVTLAL